MKARAAPAPRPIRIPITTNMGAPSGAPTSGMPRIGCLDGPTDRPSWPLHHRWYGLQGACRVKSEFKFLYRLRNSQMQANCRCCGFYPSSSPSSSATPSITASIDSVAKPRAASQRAVFAVGPRRAASRTARSRSGSSAASAGSRASGSIPSRSSLKAMAASPRPRSASATARTWANRSSSIAPCRRRVATASSRSVLRMPFRSSASRTACSEWSRRARTRAPAATASLRRSSRLSVCKRSRSSSSPRASPLRAATSSGMVRQRSPSSSTSSRPGRAGRSAVTLGIRRSLLLSRLLLGGHLDRGRQQPRRDHLVRAGVGLDLRQDLLGHVRVLAQERGCVLAALAEPLVTEAEVRARLRHDLPLEPRVEHGAFPGDTRAVDDVELGLLERRRNLVLDHLDANPVAVRLDALLERLDPADVETDRRIELQGAAARCGLRRSEHDPNLLAQLVREDADRVGAVERAGELAQRLRHQPGLEADMAVAHLALDLGLRGQRRDRVDGDDVEGAGADQQLSDLERLLARVRLGDEQVVDVHPDVLRIGGVHRVLGVDERADAAAPLRLGYDVVDEGRLARGLGAEDLDDSAAWQAADSPSEVERERPGRDRADRHRCGVVHLHHGALAESTLDLPERGIKCLLAIHGLPPYPN